MRWRIWRSEIPKISGTWRGRIYRGVLTLLISNSQWILGLKAGEREAGGFPFDWVPPVLIRRANSRLINVALASPCMILPTQII
jgi:hypothetical protein